MATWVQTWKVRAGVGVIVALGTMLGVGGAARGQVSYQVLHAFVNPGSNPVGPLVQGSDGDFYGTASAGGTLDRGTVFKISATGTFTVLHSFDCDTEGCSPTAGLIQARDGNFYGTTPFGGAGGFGTVFKITATGTFTALHSFDCATEGCQPLGLIQASDGNFYGTTGGGFSSGTAPYGSVFKMDAAGTLAKLHSFDCATEGCSPTAGLIQARDGNFYGTTADGPRSSFLNRGTVFKMDAAGTVTTLHFFVDCATAEGCVPAGLIQARDGNFYGATVGGAGTFGGAIYKMDAAGTLTPLHSFDCATEGCVSLGGLIQARDDNFYGTTVISGGTFAGTIYKMDAAGTLRTLRSFDCATEGCEPHAGLIQARDGNLYGTTGGGGATGWGTVFRTDAAGSFIFYSLGCSPDGCRPAAGLIQARDGSFYGTTEDGGAAGGGTIYKMDAAGRLTALHSFDCGTDGCQPAARLIQADDGNFYGTAVQGGAPNSGTIFKIDAAGENFVTLHSFDCAIEGCAPGAGLIQARDGNFYGTTVFGGAAFGGTVYKMDAAGTLTTLHSFDCATEGCWPHAGLMQARDGNFYGTTVFGGAAFGGTVYKMDAAGTLTTLHSFDCATEGCAPAAGLIQAADGNFYGTTQFGGTSGGGTVFKINAAGKKFVTLHSFDCATEGCAPAAGLIQARDGNFYGTTSQGGVANGGTVFTMDAAGTLAALRSFACRSDGCFPRADLMQANDGDLYGTASSGGPPGGGVVFRVHPPVVVERFSGSAQGVGRGSTRTGISIVGTFVLDGKVDLGAVPASLTIASLLSDGARDVAGLPLTLFGDPRNNVTTAYFRTAVGTVPIAKVAIGSRGGGVFTFRIEVSKAASVPSDQCPNTTLILTTAFVIEDAVNAPVTFSTQRPWLCFGPSNEYLNSRP